MFSTVFITFASGFRGSVVYIPSTSDSIITRVAPTVFATRTESMSLSLKFTRYPLVKGISSSTDVTSFSFIIGITPVFNNISRTLHVCK